MDKSDRIPGASVQGGQWRLCPGVDAATTADGKTEARLIARLSVRVGACLLSVSRGRGAWTQ